MGKEHTGINSLRVFASFLVVFIHVSPEVFSVASDDWLGVNIAASFSRVSVPLFFMASGYFALRFRDEDSLKSFFKKKILRLFIPLTAWSIFYIIYNKTTINPSTIWGLLTITPAHYHLWFFYTLIPMILISPILSIIVIGSSKRHVIYLSLLWLSLSLLPSLVQALQYFIHDENPLLKVGKAQLFLAMIGYFLLGGLLRNIKFDISTKLLSVIIFLSTTATVVATCIFSNIKGQPSQAFFVYYSPFIATASISLFMLFERLTVKNNAFSKAINSTAKLSLGIYLIHPVFIDIFKPMILESTSLHLLLFMTMIIFVISGSITFLLSKIPIIKKTVL
ncbi:acyltransferase family protein [Serratia marcescens]|uniref:Acyltransferase family protein n=1 Tax=Serratia marcescens TaxID=615 RepID=A0A5C7CM21_SERMA|nr:acyltransferase family protein [Serratia marcescens]TXE34112.1 acyltransferase family protein [Serratia marcescens]TXE66845.1 acyltransferase family protein [Serratia marcescens]